MNCENFKTIIVALPIKATPTLTGKEAADFLLKEMRNRKKFAPLREVRRAVNIFLAVFDKRKYWHELSDAEITELIEKKTLIGYILKHYKQPKWCNYPEALAGAMGCWSLTDNLGLRHNISKEYCRHCDCAKHYKPEDKDERRSS